MELLESEHQIWGDIRYGRRWVASASVYKNWTTKGHICTDRQGGFCVLGFAFEATLGGRRGHDRLVQRCPAAFHSWRLQNTGLFHDGLVWRGNRQTVQIRKTHMDKTRFCFCMLIRLSFLLSPSWMLVKIKWLCDSGCRLKSSQQHRCSC